MAKGRRGVCDRAAAGRPEAVAGRGDARDPRYTGHTPPSICVVVYEHPDDAVPYGLLIWDTLFVGRCGLPDAGVVGPTARDTGAQTVSIAARQTAATARCHTENSGRPHYFESDACSSGRAAAPKSGVLALASTLRCQLGRGQRDRSVQGLGGLCRWYGPSAAVSPVTSFQTANRRIIFGAMVVSGEAMAAGPEVRGNHAERPRNRWLAEPLDWRALRSDHDEFVDSGLEQDRGVGTGHRRR